MQASPREEFPWSIQQVGMKILLGVSPVRALEADYKVIQLGPFMFSIQSTRQELPLAKLTQWHLGNPQNC